MTKILNTVSIMLLFGVFLGCHPDNRDIILREAEECMEISPDSVIRMFEKIDFESFDCDYQQAKYALLWTQASHKCHLKIENDSLINVAVEYYTRHDKRHYAAKSFLYKGLLHKQRKEVEQAAEAFALSEQWFEGVEDNQYKALLYNHYGMLMNSQSNYEEALIYLKKSYWFKLKGDSIHYVMSACGAIANVYRKLGLSDSAKLYFEKGLEYEGKVSLYRYSLFKQNYANFLRRNGEYDKAERMLLECEQYITDENKYSLYSSLATLYYETEEYGKALLYAEKVIESEDSVVVRGGLLNLYRIHRQLGHANESQSFHDLYREYDSDITMRMKTVEVAAIPHEVKVKVLESAHQKGMKVRWGLTACLIGVLMTGGILYIFLRKRHSQQRLEWQNKLAEDDREISKMTQVQSEKDKEIGQLNYQMERKIGKIENMEQKQKERLEKEKEKVKEKKDEIKQLREAESVIMREKRELEKNLEASHKQQRELQMVADRVEHDKRIDRRIMYFRTDERVEHIGALLMQLKHGNMYVGEPVPEQEIRPMLIALLDAEYPGVRQSLDALANNQTKRFMCYLIVLGLDDEEMMYRATGKRVETIKKYHKECRQLVEALKEEQGNEN